MELIYFILVSQGLTQILCYGEIFNTIRPAHRFFTCPMCIGFWAGLFVWALSCYTTLFIFDYTIVTGFFLACLSSGTSYTLSMLISDNGLQLGMNKEEVQDVTHNN